MRITVGIIGTVISIIAMAQSLTVTGLSIFIGDEFYLTAGSYGIIISFLIFFGSAFSFGIPVLSQVLFFSAFLLSIPARGIFTDIWIYGIISAVLSVLLFFRE